MFQRPRESVKLCNCCTIQVLGEETMMSKEAGTSIPSSPAALWRPDRCAAHLLLQSTCWALHLQTRHLGRHTLLHHSQLRGRRSNVLLLRIILLVYYPQCCFLANATASEVCTFVEQCSLW